MKRLFISEENLKTLIKNLKKNCDEFIAPKREHLEDIIFGDTKEDSRELLNYEGNSIISPREFLLPRSEIIFEIKSAKENRMQPVEDKKKRVFYGVRPCDIVALVLMRRFFLEGVVDVPYKQKFENSLFISLACTGRCSNLAFCDQMSSGPIAKEGFDLQLMPVSAGFLVEAGTTKGRKVISRNKKLFKNASVLQERELKGKLGESFGKAKKFDYKKIARIMQEDKIKPSVWEDIGTRCVVCSGCITLCPTCSCFSITDRLTNDKGERLRYCDGCPYAGFTRMAGGSTPFPEHKDHIRRFFEHKLNVDVQRYGRPSCVGCTRCIQTCPGNISIYKFIKEALAVPNIR